MELTHEAGKGGGEMHTRQKKHCLGISIEEARIFLKTLYYGRKIYEHYFPGNNAYCFYLERPDEAFQNYFAIYGKAGLIVF